VNTQIGSEISKCGLFLPPVIGHVTRACAVIVSDNGNVIKYSVIVTQ